MNRERAKELLPIIEAYANGEDIQFHDGDGWSDIGDEELDEQSLGEYGLIYRIKPSPREFWIARYPDNDASPFVVYDGAGPPTQIRNDWIKVREVLK